MKKYNVCEPIFYDNEIKYVNKCLRNRHISSFGDYIPKLEHMFSTYCNKKYGVACSNGTAALHLALLSLGVSKHDEIIVPSFSMIAIPNAVYYTGAKIVVADVDKYTWNIDCEDVLKKITKKTKAIICMHTYGVPCSMDDLIKICKLHNIVLIEDCAQAHGAMYNGKRVGSFGDISCFSYYANKTITCGEGGMVLTNNKKIYNKLILFRNHYFGKNRFIHTQVGYNYRMTNIQAALGVAQFENIDKIIKNKIQIGMLYKQFLKNVGVFQHIPHKTSPIYWMNALLIKNKTKVVNELTKNGIETRPFFYPVDKQPCYKHLNLTKTSVASHLYKYGLYLPSASNLKPSDIKYICDFIKSISGVL